ncbi:MAG: GGDEF domain-containing protein [Deltaproteobacteria bacterium]|nr:MAG: GGDEF domain-containing protein [Deltaproteobacteria bacterium]
MKKRTTQAAILLAVFITALTAILIAGIKVTRDLAWESAMDSLSDRVVFQVNEMLWRRLIFLSQQKENIVNGSITLEAGNIISSVAILPSPDEEREKSLNRQLTGGAEEDLSIFIGNPKPSLERGLVIPFSIRSRSNARKYIYGELSIPEIFSVVDSLAGRNIFLSFIDPTDKRVLLDSAERAGDFRLKKLVSSFRTWEEFLPFFNLKLLFRAPENAFPLPIATQGLFFAVYILLLTAFLTFYVKVLRPAAMASDFISEKVATKGEGDSVLKEINNIYLSVNALVKRLEELEKEKEMLSGVSRDEERAELESLRQKYSEMLEHHKTTKKMLKSLKKELVPPILREGLEHLGFRDVIVGLIDREKRALSFKLDPVKFGRGTLSIPLDDDSYFISRVVFSGIHHFLRTTEETNLRYDDRVLLGERSVLVAPLMKSSRNRCFQFFQCDRLDCPSHIEGDQRCWIRQGTLCHTHTLTERKEGKLCVDCPMFLVEGVLIVREGRGGKELLPQETKPIMQLVSEASLAFEVAEIYEEAERMSVTDGLTGLYNHREFYRHLRVEVERARRYNSFLSVLMIDVDDFKIYNDTFGHLAGDMALRKVADAIRRNVRSFDIVARYGGEEFAVILPETDQNGAIALAERIKNEIGKINFSPVEDELTRLTVSIGLCSMRGGDMPPDKFISMADSAAYEAKRMGKNRICVSGVSEG